MKILKIQACHYDDCIRRFYRQHRFVKDLPYEEHLSYLESYSPVHINHFRRYMRRLGHEAEVIIYDLESLQKSWAAENQFRHSNEHWRVDIILQQIQKFQPEVLYLQDIYGLPHFLRKRIKTFFPSIKKVLLFRGFPGAMEEVKDVDFVFTGTPLIRQAFDRAGFKTDLLYHSFETNILTELEKHQKGGNETYPFTFLGYSGYGGHGECHRERYHLLTKLLDETDISLWASEALTQGSHERCDSIQPLSIKYADRVSTGCFGLEMYDLLQRSEIVFNKHTEAANGIIGNMRLFEATGVGACLLTDTGSNMHDLFEEDKEIVCYHSDDELFEKLDYLRNNPNIRKEIAKAGQARVLKDHTVQQRCEQISQRIDELCHN